METCKIIAGIVLCGIANFFKTLYYSQLRTLTLVAANLTKSTKLLEIHNSYKLRLSRILEEDGTPDPTEPKYRSVYIALSFLLPGLGAGNAYIGRKKRAKIQNCMTIGGLILTALFHSSFFFLVALASALWGIIDAFLIKTDAFGNKMLLKPPSK